MRNWKMKMNENNYQASVRILSQHNIAICLYPLPFVVFVAIPAERKRQIFLFVLFPLQRNRTTKWSRSHAQAVRQNGGGAAAPLASVIPRGGKQICNRRTHAPALERRDSPTQTHTHTHACGSKNLMNECTGGRMDAGREKT